MRKIINKLVRPFKKSRMILVSFIITVFSFLFVLATLYQISYLNKIVVNYSKISNAPSSLGKLDVTMEIPIRSDGVKNCWQEDNGSWGSQYDIYIHNETDFPFVDWTLNMTVPKESRIDSSWNGEYVNNGTTITIRGSSPAFTAIAPAHNNVKLGFVLYTDELLTTSDFYLSGKFYHNPAKDKLFIFATSLFSVAFIVFVISVILFYLVEKQSKIDNEKIESLLRLCARFIDVRDEYTKMHSSHVGLYSKKIAEELGYDEDFQKSIYYMGMMHDVGKVLIPREILCKPSKLNDEEWFEMKKHTLYGADILEGFTMVDGIQAAALYHHERYDGKGYPKGLKGEEIPIQARIICVADSYDAMHTDRSYRVKLENSVILAELEKNKGTQFDPKVADAMIKLLKENVI